MKIAYNPTGGSALSKSQIDSLKNDIIFDLSGMAVYARGIPVGKVYLPFEKSTSSTTEGYNGLVPFPDYNGNSKTRFLREDGTWVVPTNTNNYRPISINGTSILENNNTALNLVAGNNITLNPKKDSNNKYTGEVTITANAIGIKDLSGTSFSTYLKSSITYGYNSDETKKDNIVGDFGIFNMQTSSYTESNHFYFRQFRGQARIDKLYTRLYYKRENEDIKYTDWKEILKLGDYTTLAGYGITDAVTLNTDQTISGEKTFSKFKVSNKNLVTNLNANMVGGYDSSTLFTCESGYGVDVNAPHRNKESGPLLYKISSNCTNIPSGCTDGVLVHFNSQGTDTAFQLVSDYSNTVLYYRSGNLYESGTRYLYNRAWKKLAFTDSNITGNSESATKLQTTRKIWGQNFDGTANVSGGMTGVTSIENSSGLSIISNGLGFAPENAGDLKGALTIGGSVDYGLAIWGDGSGKSYLQSGRTDGKNAAYNLILQHLGGNVGIGTTSPDEKLEVSGNIKAEAFLGNLDGSYINKLTGYTKPTTSSDITANDTLNAALGKLELKAGTAYDLVKGAYNGDGTIENLAEILKVLEGISDTDTIKSLLGKYRRLDKDEFYDSEVRSNFWINRTIEGGGGWAYVPILVFKADKKTKLLNIGVYGDNSDLIYSYIGSNDHNSTKNLRIYPDGTVTAPVFNGNLNYTNLTGSTTTANQAIVSNGTKDGWTLKTLGSNAFNSNTYLQILGNVNANELKENGVGYITLNGPNGNGSVISFGGTNYHTQIHSDYLGNNLYWRVNKNNELQNWKQIVTTDFGMRYFNSYVIENSNAVYDLNKILGNIGCTLLNTQHINGPNDANLKYGAILLFGSPTDCFGLMIVSYNNPSIYIRGGNLRDNTINVNWDWVNLLHSGNTRINNGTITINGNTITPLTTGYIGTTQILTTSKIQALTGITSLSMSDNINILSGNSDKYITFGYSNNAFTSADAYSWRLGYIGSGEGNANYFKIQSSHGNTWTDVLKLGLLTYEATFSGNVIASGNITASKFITTGGTASQFVKGDGSLDSISYVTTTTLENYVTKTEFPNLSSKGLYKILTSSGGGSNINKWKKFARINLSSDQVYTQCGGYMFIYDHEGHRVKGILDFHVRTEPDTSINKSNINLQSPHLKWHILDNSNYASNIKMVKVENGIFDLYITTSQTYTTLVILVFTPKSDKITLFDETWIDTLPENVICTSSYTITVPNATTATKLANTLTFSAGAFVAKTYNGSSATTINIPTHTSHLTNNSFAVHNDAVKNVISLTRSTLGYAYNSGANADTFWYTAGPVSVIGVSKYLCAIQADASNNTVIKFRKVVNGTAQKNWRTFVNSDGTQIGSSVRPVYVKNDGSVAPFTLSNATANDTRNILVGHDNGIYLVTSAKINPSAGILIANGFVKSNSSDSHVLLGAGGHKAISDFVLKSEFDTQELSSNLTTITIKSLAVTTDWMDTGIIGSYKNESNTLVSGDLETGTYIVQVYCSGAKSGGTSKFYNCYWSGVMSWYSGTNSTNSLGEDEILLHRSGHADNNCTIYLRTKLLSGCKGLKLLIAANQAMDGAEYTFKFKRVI